MPSETTTRSMAFDLHEAIDVDVLAFHINQTKFGGRAYADGHGWFGPDAAASQTCFSVPSIPVSNIGYDSSFWTTAPTGGPFAGRRPAAVSTESSPLPPQRLEMAGRWPSIGRAGLAALVAPDVAWPVSAGSDGTMNYPDRRSKRAAPVEVMVTNPPGTGRRRPATAAC